MNDWLMWNGVKSTDLGVRVVSQPSIIAAAERVETVEVPGRSGSLTILDGANVYDDIALAVTCFVEKPDRIREICGWLRGSGELTFADRSDGYYIGRVSNQISFDQIVKGNPHRAFQLQFRCQPFFYLNEGRTATTVQNGSPASLNNVGNVPSQPLIKLFGTREGTIMCGNSTMLINSFEGVSYILLDCEAKLAYQGERGNPSDPLRLLGTRVTGEWAELPVGTAFVTVTGGISRAEIVPRWRCVGR